MKKKKLQVEKEDDDLQSSLVEIKKKSSKQLKPTNLLEKMKSKMALQIQK